MLKSVPFVKARVGCVHSHSDMERMQPRNVTDVGALDGSPLKTGYHTIILHIRINAPCLSTQNRNPGLFPK